MILHRPLSFCRSLLAGELDIRKRGRLSRVLNRLQAGSYNFDSNAGPSRLTTLHPVPEVSSEVSTACSRGAFTLIEVLISLAILGLAAIVLGAAYANTLEAHRAIAARAAAGAPVDFLREVVLNEPERDKVEKGGDLSLPDNRRLRWEAKIEEAVVPDLFQVVIQGRVDGEANRPAEEFSQTLMLLRPTWSDASRREQLRSEWRASRPQEEKK
ncbi:MAG: hypothetical protein C0518_11400 [Opitutus sp.]|nr:hypothetical protein [Opitutus sp.]